MSEENRTIRIEHFLKELEYLTEKYQIKIWGCGCCDSPRLIDLKNDEILAMGLEYDKEEKCYTALGTVENKGFYTSN